MFVVFLGELVEKKGEEGNDLSTKCLCLDLLLESISSHCGV